MEDIKCPVAPTGNVQELSQRPALANDSKHADVLKELIAFVVREKNRHGIRINNVANDLKGVTKELFQFVMEQPYLIPKEQEVCLFCRVRLVVWRVELHVISSVETVGIIDINLEESEQLDIDGNSNHKGHEGDPDFA